MLDPRIVHRPDDGDGALELRRPRRGSFGEAARQVTGVGDLLRGQPGTVEPARPAQHQQGDGRSGLDATTHRLTRDDQVVDQAARAGETFAPQSTDEPAPTQLFEPHRAGGKLETNGRTPAGSRLRRIEQLTPARGFRQTGGDELGRPLGQNQ